MEGPCRANLRRHRCVFPSERQQCWWRWRSDGKKCEPPHLAIHLILYLIIDLTLHLSLHLIIHLIIHLIHHLNLPQ